jgi:hypothetical protein
MLLSEKSITNLISDIKKQNAVIDMIEIKCQKEKGKGSGKFQDTCLFKGDGQKDLIVDEDYYYNLEENLKFIKFGWLDDFYENINRNHTKIFANVYQDGTVSDSVRVEIRIGIPSSLREAPFGFLEKYFNILSKYHKFLLNCEISSINYAISTITFEMQFSTREMMKTVRKSTPNVNIAKQWLMVHDYIYEEIEKKHSLTFNVRVVDGRMDHNRLRKKVTCKFVDGEVQSGEKVVRR